MNRRIRQKKAKQLRENAKQLQAMLAWTLGPKWVQPGVRISRPLAAQLLATKMHEAKG